MFGRAIILIVLGALAGEAAAPDSEFAAGRAYYGDGEFKKAAIHFQMVLTADPDDAEACYWTGMAYARMADIATPFGGRYSSKARAYLVKAVKLAPGRPDYRRALFDFLLDSADSSRTALRDAAGILRAMPESDPDYADMWRRFHNERKANSSAEARLGRVLLLAPRAAYSIAAVPGSMLSNRRIAAWSPAEE